MKKITALILASVMLLSALALLASCGETGKTEVTTVAEAETEKTTTAETEPAETEPTFPVADYGQQTFTVYARTSGGSYEAKYMITEEDGDVVNDATFKRNCMVEDKYNVKIGLKEAEAPSGTIAKDISAGSIDYDIILERRNSISQSVIKGNLMPFEALGVDFDNDWWDSNSKRDLSIDGKTFLMQNSVSVARLAGIRFFYFNKQIVEDYKLVDPYECLKKDTWTLDTFLEMCKGVTCTVGTLGTYALVLEMGSSNGVYMHMLVGSGIRYTKVDGDEVVVDVDSQIEKIDSFFDSLRSVFSDKTHVITMDEAVEYDVEGAGQGSNKYEKSRDLFAQGHFLFTQSSITASTQFTEMKDDFGCMPNPKLNSDQAEYAHKCDPYTLIFAIPNDKGINTERLGVIMDYWGYASLKTTVPAYYDITIKTKRVQEATASEVIDLTVRTAYYEFTDVFKIGNISTALDSGYKGTGLASSWKTYQASINAQVKAFNKSIAKLED